MGPHEANGSMSSEIQQAHSMLSAASLGRSCGPIHGCREYFLGPTMGLYEAIGSISLEKLWAYTWPIGSIFQDSQWAHMRPSAAFHRKYNRPIQCYRQHPSGEVMGLSMAVGSIFQDSQWAHMRPSAASLRRSYGPIHGHREYYSRPTMGPHEAIGSISLEIQ